MEIYIIAVIIRLISAAIAQGIRSSITSFLSLKVRLEPRAFNIELMPGIVAVIQTSGSRINFHPYIHVLVSERRALCPLRSY
jgi:hypothetical protein